MNRTISILLCLILSACGAPSETPQPAQPQTIIINQPPDPIGTRVMFLYNTATGSFGTTDGRQYEEFGVYNSAANARWGFVALDDVLHAIDDTGESLMTDRLPCAPDVVTVAADTWSFVKIDPATSYSLGAVAKWHVKTYQNGAEYGNWFNNQYEITDAFTTASGTVVTVDTVGKYRSVTEPALNIVSAEPDGLLLHSLDTTRMVLTIRHGSGEVEVKYNLNYFIQAKKWQKSGAVWYSWNGYEFNGTLDQTGNALSAFITMKTPIEFAVIEPAGTRTEHGETVLYWVECNTGDLYRYVPSIDRLEFVISLYQGTGKRADGSIAAKQLQPVMTNAGIFYRHAGTVWKYDFVTVAPFAGVNIEFWGM